MRNLLNFYGKNIRQQNTPLELFESIDGFISNVGSILDNPLSDAIGNWLIPPIARNPTFRVCPDGRRIPINLDSPDLPICTDPPKAEKPGYGDDNIDLGGEGTGKAPKSVPPNNPAPIIIECSPRKGEKGDDGDCPDVMADVKIVPYDQEPSMEWILITEATIATVKGCKYLVLLKLPDVMQCYKDLLDKLDNILNNLNPIALMQDDKCDGSDGGSEPVEGFKGLFEHINKDLQTIKCSQNDPVIIYNEQRDHVPTYDQIQFTWVEEEQFPSMKGSTWHTTYPNPKKPYDQWTWDDFEGMERTTGTVLASARFKEFSRSVKMYFDSEENAIAFFETHVFPFIDATPIEIPGEEPDTKRRVRITKSCTPKRIGGKKLKVTKVVVVTFNEEFKLDKCYAWRAPQ